MNQWSSQATSTFTWKFHLSPSSSVIHDSTHEKSHTLDLIITRSSDRIISSRPVADELFSDHFSISCTLSLPNTQLQIKEVNIRPKNFDLQPLLDDLDSSVPCLNLPDDPDVLFDSYNSTLASFMNTMLLRERKPSRHATLSSSMLKQIHQKTQASEKEGWAEVAPLTWSWRHITFPFEK